jgi:hypothetical protein
MPNRFMYVLAVTLPVLMACGSSSSNETYTSPYTNALSRAELEGANTRNAYEAVERLRPRWLVVRSGMRSFHIETEVAVFQDEMYLGDQDVLRTIGTDGIFSIEYLDGSTAKARLTGIGDKHIQGAIIIHMQPTPEPR